MTRSPSFSRSSSSTIMTIRPAPMSLIISSVLENIFGSALKQSCGVARNDIDFQVQTAPRPAIRERGFLKRMRDEISGKTAFQDIIDRQADSVQSD